ncbi:MAG: hypothetical protein HQL51_00020 [Magnetococcales bacterium]|nr:hypothetical protein [Magnetococcales bacterium]
MRKDFSRFLGSEAEREAGAAFKEGGVLNKTERPFCDNSDYIQHPDEALARGNRWYLSNTTAVHGARWLLQGQSQGPIADAPSAA